ncbi:MAG: cytochrome c biogenesis protein ResB [Myxococcota bacterium]
MTTATLSPPREGSGGMGKVYDVVFDVFCSLRLTVVIIFMLAVGCVVGMFVDQTKPFEDHARVWAQTPWKYYTFTFLEFHDVYHSWWFGTSILLLALNLIACSIERLPKIWIDIHNPDPRLTPKRARGIKNKASFRADDAAHFKEAFLDIVGKADPPQVLEEGDTTYIFTEKHKYARTGVYVVHTALLFIMFGSIVTTSFGFDGTVGIVEGSVGRYAFGKGPAGLRYRQDLGFYIRCTDFRLKQFVDGAPLDFESDLTIITKDGREVARKTIQVNDPLEYGGYMMYQASYQPVPGDERVQLAVGRPGQPKTVYSVSPGTRISIPGTDVAYVPLEIIPQYADLGEALRVQQIQEGRPPTSFLVFKNYPDFDEQARRGEFALHYKGADKTYMTGIQVGKVPGIEVVFTGFAVMFIGMYMAFFMSHRRYWARLTRRADGTYDVLIAGAAKRHQYTFEEEFQRLVTELDEEEGVTKQEGGAAG